ncbi:Protein of unknown function, partial [Gryllus bimaculatus]
MANLHAPMAHPLRRCALLLAVVHLHCCSGTGFGYDPSQEELVFSSPSFESQRLYVGSQESREHGRSQWNNQRQPIIAHNQNPSQRPNLPPPVLGTPSGPSLERPQVQFRPITIPLHIPFESQRGVDLSQESATHTVHREFYPGLQIYASHEQVQRPIASEHLTEKVIDHLRGRTHNQNNQHILQSQQQQHPQQQSVYQQQPTLQQQVVHILQHQYQQQQYEEILQQATHQIQLQHQLQEQRQIQEQQQKQEQQQQLGQPNQQADLVVTEQKKEQNDRKASQEAQGEEKVQQGEKQTADRPLRGSPEQPTPNAPDQNHAQTTNPQQNAPPSEENTAGQGKGQLEPGEEAKTQAEPGAPQTQQQAEKPQQGQPAQSQNPEERDRQQRLKHNNDREDENRQKHLELLQNSLPGRLTQEQVDRFLQELDKQPPETQELIRQKLQQELLKLL